VSIFSSLRILLLLIPTFFKCRAVDVCGKVIYLSDTCGERRGGALKRRGCKMKEKEVKR